MTDVKLAEIENERKRLLANWLTDSEPYHQVQSKMKDKFFSASVLNDSFLLSKKFDTQSLEHLNVYPQQQPQKNPKSDEKPSFHQHEKITSFKSNKPLRVAQSSFDAFKPSSRPFMTRDTSANTFSVTDFENSRLARKNEIEFLKLKSRPKTNATNSGYDSGGIKLLNSDTTSDPITMDIFLDRFHLPQVAHVLAKQDYKIFEKKIRKKSSLKSFLQHFPKSGNQHMLCSNPEPNFCNELKTNNNNIKGQLCLLHRVYQGFNVYHAISEKRLKNISLKVPQNFKGYFSLVENGTPTAITYTTITQLVREQVLAFLSLKKLRCYTESSTHESITKKMLYTKMFVKAGEILLFPVSPLMAVFEDFAAASTNRNKNWNNTAQEKEKGRYVQLMLEHNHQIIYVPISTKGSFFEIDSQLNQSGHCTKRINPNCVYRINNVINEESIFPVSLCLMVNQNNTSACVSLGNISVLNVSKENFVIASPINRDDSHKNGNLEKIHYAIRNDARKVHVGFDSENELFSNQNIQHALKFCNSYCESFLSAVEIERSIKTSTSASVGFKKEKSKSFLKLFSSDKNSPAHEIEDSIIFISKKELQRIKSQECSKKCFNPKESSFDNQLRSCDNFEIKINSELGSVYGSSNLNITNETEPMIESISVVSRDSHSSKKPKSKYFSLQNLENSNKEQVVTTPEGKYPNLESLDCMKPLSSSSNDNFELIQSRQKSFITEKLFNEFYHSTKHQSKSSACIISQLLHFSNPQKMNIKEKEEHQLKS